MLYYRKSLLYELHSYNMDILAWDTLVIFNIYTFLEFDGKNFDKIFDDLREYNETHESELKKSKKEIEELEIIKKNIIDIIKSKDIRDVIKDNLDDFNRIFQEVNNDEITILKYLLKLGEILNKKI